MADNDELQHHDDLDSHVREVQQLLARHKLVEELVHRQEMPRHALVESLVHKQHIQELTHKLDSLHSADVAYILEALPLDDRLTLWQLVKADRDGDILLECIQQVIKRLQRQPVLLHDPGQIAEKRHVRNLPGRQAIKLCAVFAQAEQPGFRQFVALVGNIVCRTRKAVDHMSGMADALWQQPGTDREVFIMINRQDGLAFENAKRRQIVAEMNECHVFSKNA